MRKFKEFHKKNIMIKPQEVMGNSWESQDKVIKLCLISNEKIMTDYDKVIRSS